MKDSAERVRFITDYIVAYEEKIKLLNSHGLFDEAKLFELFAIEVSHLYFGQKFTNLNADKMNYPYVDLISEDGLLFLQVSTEKNIPAKIKKTLEKIRDSKINGVENIKTIKFFALSNESVDKVNDYTGENQIGNISFVKATDLVTTQDIIHKATNDLQFQIDLYNLLQKEIASIKDDSERLSEAIYLSKTVGLSDIDCKINNEYEIDRSTFMDQIQFGESKNISIQGGAGSGKSVICKKLVEQLDTVVYARAERFLEETDINNIWGFNVRKILEFLHEKPIVFFIDSLEFIADSKTKMDLLSALYECTKDYPSAKIVTSCRSSDKGAFLKIEGKYSVATYEVPDLTLQQQQAIMAKYPIIQKMANINSYKEFLKSPLYINLIVSKANNIDNITDENQLREHIWQHVICLDNNENKNIINSIVFARAKDFSVGVKTDNYNSAHIRKLISEGVLVQNGNTVRLKYDVFEDICFEQYLDGEFDGCKGDYEAFFKKIETLGRCIYRRYQIWIENKLLAKVNRDKFLYELIFSKEMPLSWKKQTEIGLVKSRYCHEFFAENANDIIKNGLLINFIKITNLYAFEVNSGLLNKILIPLKPSGEGRGNLIHITAVSGAYKDNDSILRASLKLCSDYAKVQNTDINTSHEACEILGYIIYDFIDESKIKKSNRLDSQISSALTAIYQLAEYSKDWIEGFWAKMTEYYKSGQEDKERLAEEVIEFTLKYEHDNLAKFLPLKLCQLAELYWFDNSEKKKHLNRSPYYFEDKHDLCYKFGLSKHAKKYDNNLTTNSAQTSVFFYWLFKYNFWDGLKWAIEFVNKVVLNFANGHKDVLLPYEIYFIDKDIKQSYLGYENMWLAITQTYSMPLVLSDLIYCLKEELRNIVKNDAVIDQKTAEFANNVKSIIYEKANNIALLTVIAAIGMEFPEKLPGYALDLCTNINLILSDLSRYTLSLKTPGKEMIEKEMSTAVGFPFSFADRYATKKSIQHNLRLYVCHMQLYYGEDTKNMCYKILDYLYSQIPNVEEYALEHFQIQAMDTRRAHIDDIGNGFAVLTPSITGAAAKISNDSGQINSFEKNTAELLEKCNKKLMEKDLAVQECLKYIDELIAVSSNSVISVLLDGVIVQLIAVTLKKSDLNCAAREKLCQIWVAGIRKLFNNGSFMFDHVLCVTLFDQIETEIGNDCKNQIKRLMLDLLLYVGSNGIINQISHVAKRYLYSYEHLARAMFNTIIKIAEDEMLHQKFNAEYLSNHKEHISEDEFEFKPNAQLKLVGVDFYIERDGESKYQSQSEHIIERYLFNENKLTYSDLDMNNLDITTMCMAMNCGLSLRDKAFASVVKKFILAMIDTWWITRNSYHSHEILGVYQTYEVQEFLKRELIASKEQALIVLDILFKGVDFSKFVRETIEFYREVFGELLPFYFDSYNNEERRMQCVETLCVLEENILLIEIEKVKEEFYKSLILSPTRYSSSGDWSKCNANYLYKDKMFLNSMFGKYGGYHLKELFNVIYKLHIDKLLPEILLSINEALQNARGRKPQGRSPFIDVLEDSKNIILMLITKAFFDHNSSIKQDKALIDSFESILELLVESNYEEAAVILDEFRIH